MSNVLITGGAGFIGSHLASLLINQGHTVFAADSLHPQVHPSRELPLFFPKSGIFIPLDVTHSGTIEPLLRQIEPDTVVHLAAETGTGQSLSEASRHALVNVVGTSHLLDAMFRIKKRPMHVVLASSRAVYGDGEWITKDGSERYPGTRRASDLRVGRWSHYESDGKEMKPVPSSANRTQLHPTNVYAATKLAQENLLSAWCAATETAFSVLRLQNVYGPGQSISNSYTGVLTYMAREAIAGKSIDVYEDGEIIRDFVFIEDVVNALAAVIASPPAISRTLDIGSGKATTIATAASLIATKTGAPKPTVSGRYREGDVRAASCSIEAAQNEIGYQPRISLEHGIEKLIDWIVTQ